MKCSPKDESLCSDNGLTERSREQRKVLVALLGPKADLVRQALDPSSNPLLTTSHNGRMEKEGGRRDTESCIPASREREEA